MTRVGGTGWQGWLLAVLLHGVGLWFVLGTSWGMNLGKRMPSPPVKLRLATRAVQRPLPVTPLVAPLAAVRVAPALAPRPRAPQTRPQPAQPRPQASAVAAPAPSAPAASAPAAPAASPRPRKFTVALEATVAGGGVAVPVSNGAGTFAAGSPTGDPNGSPDLPAGGNSASGLGPAGLPGPVAAGDLTRLPRLLSQPSAEQVRALYPEAARQAGLEGDVTLRLLVSASGQVEQVRVVRKAGHGFDEAAVRGVGLYRFEPGQQRGRARATWIPWTYKFRLGE